MFEWNPSFTRQKATPLKPKTSFSWAEEKLDGWRVTVSVDMYGKVEAYANKTDIDLSSRMIRCGIPLKSIPKGTIIDGELVNPSSDNSSDVMTGLNAGIAVFRPFAMPYYCGKPFRWKDIEIVRFHLVSLGFNPPQMWRGDHAISQAIRDNPNMEGLVFKQTHYVGWFKWKPVKTLDVFVTGWNEGSGRLEGTLGSVDVAVYCSDPDSHGIRSLGRIGTGFSDEERRMLWKKRPEVLEIQYEKLLARDGLRFGRYVRYRKDKEKHDCTDKDLT